MLFFSRIILHQHAKTGQNNFISLFFYMFILVKLHGKHAGKSQDNFAVSPKIVRIFPAIILWIKLFDF